MAQETDVGCGYEDAPAHLHRQPVENFDGLLDDRARESGLEDVSKRVEFARMVRTARSHMKNRKAILRLYSE